MKKQFDLRQYETDFMKDTAVKAVELFVSYFKTSKDPRHKAIVKLGNQFLKQLKNTKL